SFFFQAEDGIRFFHVTGVQTCALPIFPLYFLIGIWGGARREYAAIKFFIYTLFGSVFMLLVIVGLYFSVLNPNTGAHTFNMLYMMNPENYIPGSDRNSTRLNSSHVKISYAVFC